MAGGLAFWFLGLVALYLLDGVPDHLFAILLGVGVVGGFVYLVFRSVAEPPTGG